MLLALLSLLTAICEVWSPIHNPTGKLTAGIAEQEHLTRHICCLLALCD